MNDLNVQFNLGIQETQKLLDFMVSEKEANIEMLGNIAKIVENICNSYNDYDILKTVRLTQSADDVIYAHCFSVAVVSYLISKWCKLDKLSQEKLIDGAVMHDIGKLLVDEEVLNKKEQLSNQEKAQISSHTVEGYKTFRNSGLDKDVLSIILMHHERDDGSGYPLGLRGEKINYLSRIVAISDTYIGMVSHRNYRDAFAPKDALTHMYDNVDQFDKAIFNVFIDNMTTLDSGDKFNG